MAMAARTNRAGAGNDDVDAGEGDDFIRGSAGTDAVDGGTGYDIIGFNRKLNFEGAPPAGINVTLVNGLGGAGTGTISGTIDDGAVDTTFVNVGAGGGHGRQRHVSG